MPAVRTAIRSAPRMGRKKGITGLTASRIRSFRKRIYNHYAAHGRDLPWRKRVTPYRVLVSEIMLQQTQVERVIGTYREFLAAFPSFLALAKAPLPKLLRLWSGMGYNRRALALKKLAQKVVAEHKGRLPHDPEALLTLPGIGPYTAGAICAFAFNRPVVFLDTNIRRVLLHEFFPERADVRDEELLPLLEQTLDRNEPGKWYNALMDYGAMLKREHENANRRSAHYTRQRPFENSNRQVRGAVLKVLVREAPLSEKRIGELTGMEAGRVRTNLDRLVREGFIIRRRGRYLIA